MAEIDFPARANPRIGKVEFDLSHSNPPQLLYRLPPAVRVVIRKVLVFAPPENRYVARARCDNRIHHGKAFANRARLANGSAGIGQIERVEPNMQWRGSERIRQLRDSV